MWCSCEVLRVQTKEKNLQPFPSLHFLVANCPCALISFLRLFENPWPWAVGRNGHLENAFRTLGENPWKLIWSYHSFNTLPWLLVSLTIQEKILPRPTRACPFLHPTPHIGLPFARIPNGTARAIPPWAHHLSAQRGQEHGAFTYASVQHIVGAP